MNARISMREYHAAKKREDPFPSRWQEYETQKRHWVNSHPEATHTEYQAAMMKIAQGCGV